MSQAFPIDVESDALLVAGVRVGNTEACETLIRRHGPQMRAVARRFFRCEADADDAVQDAFISALRAMEGFEATSRLSTWLHRITVNACLMRLRRSARMQETSIVELLPQFDFGGHHRRQPARFADEVVDAASAGETQRIVREAIDRLPVSYRVILLLRDIEGRDTKETAAMLNTNETNVKTRLHRARQALRTLLEPSFAADSV